MDYLKYFKEKFPTNENLFNPGKLLIIILGCFGDFDSIEYAQAVFKDLDNLKKNKVNIFIVGIGKSISKDFFSEYTGIPLSHIENVEDNTIHRELNLQNKNNKNLSPMINMLLMCSGINSPGTLKEVIRGYKGDNRSSPLIFTERKSIKTDGFRIKSSLFKKISNKDNLSPFELATIRLNNMIEIISNWKLYITNSEYLVQRGATFLYSSKKELCYTFFPKSLLIYSETMNKPLNFIETNTEIVLEN